MAAAIIKWATVGCQSAVSMVLQASPDKSQNGQMDEIQSEGERGQMAGYRSPSLSHCRRWHGGATE